MAAGAVILAGLLFSARAHDEVPGAGAGPKAAVVQSEPGSNAWNAGQAPTDWRAEIERYHGHVGPWNVLGWRIGQAALREFKSQWSQHDLEVVCYVPTQTPFTCLVDGLSVGTGNSQGRLDVRLAEVLTCREAFARTRVLVLRRSSYMRASRECGSAFQSLSCAVTRVFSSDPRLRVSPIDKLFGSMVNTNPS